MSSTRIFTVFSVLAAMAIFGKASAMTVTPVHEEMISTGSASRAHITVVNNGSIPLPVEIIVRRATFDEAGLPTTSSAGDEFLVMPPQALIAPGATQNFRIQWLGDPVIEKSQSFLFYVNQIPLKFPNGKSVVQIMMAMGVMVNIAPPQGVPRLQIVATGVAIDKQGRRHPTITVENPSNIHALLPQAVIRLWSGNWSATVTPGMMSQTIGIGLIQPGHRRRFVLPVDLTADVTTVQASIDFKPKR